MSVGGNTFLGTALALLRALLDSGSTFCLAEKGRRARAARVEGRRARAAIVSLQLRSHAEYFSESTPATSCLVEEGAGERERRWRAGERERRSSVCSFAPTPRLFPRAQGRGRRPSLTLSSSAASLSPSLLHPLCCSGGPAIDRGDSRGPASELSDFSAASLSRPVVPERGGSRSASQPSLFLLPPPLLHSAQAAAASPFSVCRPSCVLLRVGVQDGSGRESRA